MVLRSCTSPTTRTVADAREPSGPTANMTVMTLGAGTTSAFGFPLHLVEAPLDDLGQQKVRNDHPDEDEEELERERREAEHLGERSEWQDRSDRRA
jgi:hypothetical protein